MNSSNDKASVSVVKNEIPTMPQQNVGASAGDQKNETAGRDLSEEQSSVILQLKTAARIAQQNMQSLLTEIKKAESKNIPKTGVSLFQKIKNNVLMKKDNSFHKKHELVTCTVFMLNKLSEAKEGNLADAMRSALSALEETDAGLKGYFLYSSFIDTIKQLKVPAADQLIKAFEEALRVELLENLNDIKKRSLRSAANKDEERFLLITNHMNPKEMRQASEFRRRGGVAVTSLIQSLEGQNNQPKPLSDLLAMNDSYLISCVLKKYNSADDTEAGSKFIQLAEWIGGSGNKVPKLEAHASIGMDGPGGGRK